MLLLCWLLDDLPKTFLYHRARTGAVGADAKSVSYEYNFTVVFHGYDKAGRGHDVPYQNWQGLC